MRKLKTWAAAAALIALSGAAQAELFDRGGGMIYDSWHGITWLSDMNYAKTSGYSGYGVDAEGRLGLFDVESWADSLRYGGYDDWTLPDIQELTDLFIADLGYFQWNPTAKQKANAALFSNVQRSAGYWSAIYLPAGYGAEVARRWAFCTECGYQVLVDASTETYFAVAVRPGDVAGVPEAQTSVMLLAGLAAVATLLKRRSR